MKKLLVFLVMAVMLLGVASVSYAAPSEDGLVLYYSFDDSTAANLAGAADLDGVVSDVDFVDGVSGKAASFDAAKNSNIVFNMTEGLESFTISFWYQVSELIDDTTPYALLGSSDWNEHAVHCHITGGVVRAAFNSSSVKYDDLKTNPFGKTPGREAEVNFPLTEDVLNQWLNFTVTFDAATKTRNFYMNGTLVGQDVAVSVGSTTFLAGEVQIGSWRMDPKRYFTGMIDELRIYDRAITVDEVAAIVDVNQNAVAIPEPTPTPEPTATPEPTERPVTPEPTKKVTTAPTEDATTAPAADNGGNGAIIWIIIGVVVVAAAVAAFIIIKNKKKTDAPAE